MSLEYIYSYCPSELQSIDLVPSVVYGEQTYRSVMYYWNFIGKHSLSHSAFDEVFSALEYGVPLKKTRTLVACLSSPAAHCESACWLNLQEHLGEGRWKGCQRVPKHNVVRGPEGESVLWACLGLSPLPQHPTPEMFTALWVSLGLCIFIEYIYSFCSQGVVLVSHKPETKYLLNLFSITRHFAKFLSSTTKLQGVLCGAILGFTNETKNPKTLDF